jgi:hypothetical protein
MRKKQEKTVEPKVKPALSGSTNIAKPIERKELPQNWVKGQSNDETPVPYGTGVKSFK